MEFGNSITNFPTEPEEELDGPRGPSLEEMQKQAQFQQAQLMQHVSDIGKVPAFYASAFSLYVTQTGMLRISAGEQLHPSAPPSFYTAITMDLNGAKGLLDQLAKTIEYLEAETKRRQEFDQTAGHG